MTDEAYKIARAFRERRRKTMNNTRTDGHTVWLFGKEIARRDENGVVLVSNAGYVTTTTHDRLNAILLAFEAPFRVCRRDFEPYMRIDGELRPWPGGWVPIHGRLAMMAIEAERLAQAGAG